MRITAIFLALLAISCGPYSKDEQRGPAGRNGVDGKNGADGQVGAPGAQGAQGVTGKSCGANPIEGGVNIVCEGQVPLFIPNGQAGADGTDGKSCVVKSSTHTAVILDCPDANEPTGRRELEMKNGKDGASCSVVDTWSNMTTIRCGNTEFTVRNGRDGLNGVNGYNGVDGKNGQNNFTTEFSDANLVTELTESSSEVTCSVDFKTNDENFKSRTLGGYLLVKGKIVARKFSAISSNQVDSGKLTFNISASRDALIAGNEVQCRAAIFAEYLRSTNPNEPIALTSLADSAGKVVTASEITLQGAMDMTLMSVNVDSENSNIKFSLQIANNAKPIEGSICTSSLKYEANVLWSDGTLFPLERKVPLIMKPVAGRNDFVIKDGLSSGMLSDIRNIELSLTCSGDTLNPVITSWDRQDLTKYKHIQLIAGVFLPSIPKPTFSRVTGIKD